MFDKIITFSLENKLMVLLGVLAMALIGVYSISHIPLDAVPDITNNQVQIVSTAPTLAPQEVEQLITYPLEAAMTNIPDVEEVRSISRYGLSVITVVFEEQVPVMLARQYVQEQLNIAKGSIPEGVTEPELMPITTGLGEIYQYVLTVDTAFASMYDATKLRTIQDWIVKRQLNGTEGIIEVSSFGGYLKQYEVALQPELLKSYRLTIPDVIAALQQNNENSGGSYIENGPHSFYIRTEGRLSEIDDMRQVWVQNNNGIPVQLGAIADIKIGHAKRYGAMTMDGQGEVVGGITLMTKGANSSEVLQHVKQRIETIQTSLPEGVHIYPYLDRSKLIGKTIDTVRTNLIEGGLIVIFVLLLLLGNLRAGLIVASVIPLSMLFALILMRYTGVSANLMSLGAIDFGIVIDGAVIIVESLLHTLTLGYLGTTLTQQQMDKVVQTSATQIYRSAAFGVLIILIVFVPILTLEGVEGKTFRPMAQTVGYAILGSMILSLTYVPVMASLFLNKKIQSGKNIAERFIELLNRAYQPVLQFALKAPFLVILVALFLLVGSLGVFNRLGAEFIPTLEEGDIAMQQAIKPGSALQESIRTATAAEKIILQHFPEVVHVISKIGTAEVPTDPMAIEDADVMIILKDKNEWTSAQTREELMDKIKAKLAPITWASYEFTQPIQLRFNELMTGAKSDISIKIFGEDVEILKSKADEAAHIVRRIAGAGDVKVDQTDGLQQLSVEYDRQRLAQYGIHVSEVNQIIRAAFAGEQVGDIFEQERRFDLVVRLASEHRQSLDLEQLQVADRTGKPIPLSEVVRIKSKEGPMLISREQARRFINVGVNVRDRDVASLVADIKTQLATKLSLPAGYEIQYGGQFENLQHARSRLLIAVPIALGLILFLLYLAFGSLIDALLIFVAVPLSAIGGIMALWLRDMPFSISSGIGFIALFGVSVLNGIVLISAIKQYASEALDAPFNSVIQQACLSRMRPVLMTALVAALGFLPMALSVGNGAEVQRPLATVVIGGLISSTLLTLVVLPTLYYWVYRRFGNKKGLLATIFIFAFSGIVQAQSFDSAESVFQYASEQHPEVQQFVWTKQQRNLDTDAIGQWQMLQLDYQGGQINYGRFDHLLSIQQDISPLLRKKTYDLQKDLVSLDIAAVTAAEKLFFRTLKRDIYLYFNAWQYRTERAAVLDSLVRLYERIEPKIQTQYNTGTIDVIEMELFQSEKHHQLRTYQLEKQQATAALQELRLTAFLDTSILITQTPLSPLTYLPADSIHAGTYRRQWYEQQQTYLKKQIELEAMLAKQANWSVGYFAQSLEKDILFQGLQVGVEIPIDKRQRTTQVQQWKLQQQRLNQEQFTQYQRIRKQRTIHLQQMNTLLRTIAQYESKTQPTQRRILDAALLQYTLGEIDFLRFSQIQERLQQQQFDYLEWIKTYNEQVIELQYLDAFLTN